MKHKKLYEEVGKKHEIPIHKGKNAIMAFVSGGTLAVIAQFAFVQMQDIFSLNKENASAAVVILIIMATALLTGLGVYDKLAQHCGAGLFIPISGFANALASSALESKSEGLIYGIGTNMFKLAGSVITYGIVSAYVFGLLRYFLGI